jgi:hypothetical protein
MKALTADSVEHFYTNSQIHESQAALNLSLSPTPPGKIQNTLIDFDVEVRETSSVRRFNKNA